MSYSTGSEEFDHRINDLLQEWGVDDNRRPYVEMVTTIFKLAQEKPSQADLKQFNRALKEMRYANKVFAPYRHIKKVCVFGSARTPPTSGEYKAAKDFAAIMRDSGYMIITGGGDGIMGASQAGAGKDRSFGLNIRLPFEQKANETILGDPKLINFKYFFTRKLSFVKESHAIALLPGGFGTMDEGFEALTLLQTGKARLIPVVMIDEPGGNFWRTFDHYLREHLLRDGWISESDFNLFLVTNDLEKARREIVNFYYNFHSYRFIEDEIVIRLQREVPPGALPRLREDFADIVVGDQPMRICAAYPQEITEPELAHLPRLCFRFDRRSFGRLRQLFNRLNEF
jgi:uncharacterized protein (TIGR00730 family)